MMPSPFVTHISIILPYDKSASDALLASGIEIPEKLKDAHPKRREKYLAGRLCAYLAFKKAGVASPQNISMSEDGSPIWPEGWTGSITHSEGLASAAIAKKAQIQSLGIDSEPLMTEKTYANVAARILFGKELEDLRPPTWSSVEWATLVFSAKEAIYKCLRPLCGAYFGFEDAEIDAVDVQKGHFKFHLTRDIGGPFTTGWQGEGSFEKKEGWIHTIVIYI